MPFALLGSARTYPYAEHGGCGTTSHSVSRAPILQEVNYVLIARHDFEFYARNPHGLMELGFRDPQLHTTVLPQLINMPILRAFLSPLLEGLQTSLTLRASLNGIALDHRLVAAESGFYLRVNLEGSPHLVSQIEHMANLAHTAVAPTPYNTHRWVSQFIRTAKPWYHSVYTGRQ